MFDGLLQQTGLAGLTDVELCSEMARSCKPDPAIFLQALAAVGVAPDRAMFVGDSVEADIVGGNRVGMRTALLSARELRRGRVAPRTIRSHTPTTTSITCSMSSTSPSTTGLPTVLLDHQSAIRAGTTVEGDEVHERCTELERTRQPAGHSTDCMD